MPSRRRGIEAHKRPTSRHTSRVRGKCGSSMLTADAICAALMRPRSLGSTRACTPELAAMPPPS
eukprot:353970-Chlamydomonas_euryale.AAC.3